LGVDEAWPLLCAWNDRCSPPWDTEAVGGGDSLRKALEAAAEREGKGGRVSVPSGLRPAIPRAAAVDVESVAKQFAAGMSVTAEDWAKNSPVKMEAGDIGAVAKLFDAASILSIVTSAKQDQEGGKWKPSGAGHLMRAAIVAQGERRLVLRGYNQEAGAWVRINPMKAGTNGASDADVKEFRHILLESDKMPRLLQLCVLNRLRLLGLPVALVVDSGGQSFHCWVRVNCSDLEGYQATATRLFALPLGFDRVNRNPSRLSRFPGVRRGDQLQACLYLNPDASPLTEETMGKIEAAVGELVEKLTLPAVESSAAVGEVLEAGEGSGVAAEVVESAAEVVKTDTLPPAPQGVAVKAGSDDDLMRVRYLFDVKRPPPGDESELIKDRFLCRGGGALLIGQTGKGKSSLAMQAMLSFSIGRTLFGIKPNGPLKCLLVQAENDDGDLTEARDGVEWATMGVDEDDETRAMMRGNTMVVSENSLVGERMFTVLGKRLAVFKPDLLIIDPALSFTEGDTSASRDVGKFLRQQLNPLLSAHQCGCLLIHHTPKPSSDKRAVNHSGSSYAGLGSAEWANWARAVLTVEELGGGRFKLHAPKRGGRLGWRDCEGNPAYFKTLEHSTNEAGFCWQEVTGAAAGPADSDGKPGKPGIPQLVELVPESGMILKASLVVKMQGAGFAEKWGRDVLAAAIGDGSLFEWTVPRPGKKSGVGIARFEQPMEDESTNEDPY
jgi:hypothetical protein